MGKGRRNKVLKLTPAKVKYVTRAKSDNISSRIIAIEMNSVSEQLIESEDTRYHESLDEKHYLRTLEDAFWSRIPDECKLN